jgi:hypothetical protein
MQVDMQAMQARFFIVVANNMKATFSWILHVRFV